jgi:hypothetical protein
MATIKEKYLLVANFEQSQEKIMSDVITDTSETILDANREQMLLGLDKRGQEIIPPYKPFTRERKQEQGRDPDTVTLYDTGEFHRQMFMKVEGKNILIDSKDEKTNELMVKYDKQDTVLGIPETAKTNINESIMDKFINIFRLMTKL